MTPREIKSALAELGGGTNKRLGQHFLINAKALEVIVTAADIHPGDRVLEVGPGLGVLTDALLRHGAEIIAIEQDRRFIEWHARRSEVLKNVRMILGDAASMEWDEVVGDGPWKFISNLPYSITSLALRKALWAHHPPTKIVVLVQREVAERIISIADGKRGKTSLLSLMVALASTSARLIRRVPAGAFYPPPKVESAVLEIIPMSWEQRRKKWGVDPEITMALAKKGFAHPRKFLVSNLALGFPLLTINDLRSTFDDLALPKKARAEDLSPEAWSALAKGLDTSPDLL